MSHGDYLPLAEKAGVTPTRSPIPCRFSAGDSFSNAVRFSCDGEWMKDDKLMSLGHDAFRVKPINGPKTYLVLGVAPTSFCKAPGSQQKK